MLSVLQKKTATYTAKRKFRPAMICATIKPKPLSWKNIGSSIVSVRIRCSNSCAPKPVRRTHGAFVWQRRPHRQRLRRLACDHVGPANSCTFTVALRTNAVSSRAR